VSNIKKILVVEFKRDSQTKLKENEINLNLLIDEKLIDENQIDIDLKKIKNNEDTLIPFFKGKNLISKYDFIKEAVSISSQLKQRCQKSECNSVLLISPSNPQIFFSLENINIYCVEYSAMLLNYYFSYFQKKEVIYEKIIIENNDILKEFFESYKNTLFIIYKPKKKELSDIIQYIPDKEIEIYINPILKSISAYKNIEEFCLTCLRRKVININTAKRFSKEWSKNFLLNSKRYISNKGIEPLINLLDNKYPAIVIGAGSSVDETICLLKEFSKVGFVIAVDTAIIPLEKAGIDIDIIVSSDSQSANSLYITHSDIVKNKGKDSNKIILVAMPTVHPAVIHKWEGKIAFSSIPFSFVKEIDSISNDKIEIGSGGTVSALAFELLELLNPSEIFLIGLDFNYSKGKLHCNNSLFDSIYYSKTDYKFSYQTFIDRMILKSNPFKLVNEFGIKTRSDPKFIMFLDWFQTHLKRYEGRKGIYVLSKKTYGLPISYFMDLEKFNKYIEKKKKKSKKDELIEKINKIDFELENKENILINYRFLLEKIKTECLTARSMIESVLKRIENQNYLNSETILRFINSLERNLLHFSTLKNLLTMSFQNYLLNVQYENKEIDTISFYKEINLKLDEILRIIEKI